MLPEILDLEPIQQEQTCKSLAPYPEQCHGTYGVLVANQTPVMCGGYKNGLSEGGYPHGTYLDTCYKYDNNSWKLAAKMTHKRHHPAMIEINDTTVFVIGGSIEWPKMMRLKTCPIPIYREKRTKRAPEIHRICEFRNWSS